MYIYNRQLDVVSDAASPTKHHGIASKLRRSAPQFSKTPKSSKKRQSLVYFCRRWLAYLKRGWMYCTYYIYVVIQLYMSYLFTSIILVTISLDLTFLDPSGSAQGVE